MTYTLISTVTVGAGGAASIDFTSIPQTYNDLVLILSGRSNDGAATADGVRLKINGATTTTTFAQIVGTGSGVTSNGGTDDYLGNVNGGTSTANTFASMSLHLSNYASTTTNKAYLQEITPEINASAMNMFMTNGVWASTAAITSLSLYITGFSFVQYSTASLYGIK